MAATILKIREAIVGKKVILLLDGHTSYCKNLEALQLAVINGIVLLQLPGHTTHGLQ